MLHKGTEYHYICSICMKPIPKGTEYRNIQPINITVLCTFGTIP
jgi:hypothetical protein